MLSQAFCCERSPPRVRLRWCTSATATTIAADERPTAPQHKTVRGKLQPRRRAPLGKSCISSSSELQRPRSLSQQLNADYAVRAQPSHSSRQTLRIRYASSLATMCKKATCDMCGESVPTMSHSLPAFLMASPRRQAILVGMWQCICAAFCPRDEQLLTFTSQAHSKYHGSYSGARQMHVQPQSRRRGQGIPTKGCSS